HVGRHEFARVVLAHGKMKALEQIVEGEAPVGIAPDRGAVASLQRRRLEQTAVQERDSSEHQSGLRAARRWAIERAKAQGVQKGAVKVTAGGERAIEQARDVSRVAVEPAL